VRNEDTAKYELKLPEEEINWNKKKGD